MSTTRSTTPTLQGVALDLYKDIHKGIRAELFSVTGTAGSIDPADRAARLALAEQVAGLAHLLVTHAEHEDAAIQPVLVEQLPDLAERVELDHLTLEARLEDLRAWALAAADAHPRTGGPACRTLYVELASFTSAYLDHQDVEERVIMPALEAAVGVEAVLAIHQAIVGSIPPEEMGAALAVMLPAMNVEDRTELLGGMRAGAPAEVFEGVWALAGSVLEAHDHAAVAARLGLG